ncbi:MAG: hypothetical protein M4579_003422 [Chaenotheca gracillima]|nr:MAG: hypothetical protein M4579_003422 [Chaenotheca gracillima]
MSVLKWYQNLQPRVLDLVGDYAGKELFLIEGDSMLLECFQDARIDFENGFQLLHAVYAVESFLENFVRRKCNFHVAFFDGHEHICIPPDSNPAHRQKYLLARSVVRKHLEARLSETHSTIEIHHFSSVEDVVFQDYLEKRALYFVMCHDAASPTDEKSTKRSRHHRAKHLSRRRFMRGIIKSFLDNGTNIALINGLEWRDTKIMAMVKEGLHISPESAQDSGSESLTESESESSDDDDSPQSYPYTISAEQGVQYDGLLGEGSSVRDRLTVFALSKLLEKDPSKDYGVLVAAFLLHTTLLEYLTLSQRSFAAVNADGEGSAVLAGFLDDFADVSRAILEHHTAGEAVLQSGNIENLADLVDGRLFRAILYSLSDGLQLADLHQTIQEKYKLLSKILADTNDGPDISLAPLSNVKFTLVDEEGLFQSRGKVLPFHNPIFDKHLSSIEITVEEDGMPAQDRFQKPSQDVSLWHNPTKLLDPKKPRPVRSRWEESRFLRSNQRYMAEMAAYAASLTNAVGKSLSPETIIVQDPAQAAVATKKKAIKPESESTKSKKQNKGPPSARDKIAASISEKHEKEVDRIFKAWAVNRRQNLDRLKDLESRYVATKAYSRSLSTEKARILRAEIALYNIQTLVLIWERFCQRSAKRDGYHAAALIWDFLKNVSREESALSPPLVQHLTTVDSSMGLPPLRKMKPGSTHPLSFDFRVPKNELSIGLPTREFQLVHAGPYMDRNVDSAEDDRVRFVPDGWQRKVLDELDAGHSLFVVAPTSAGKTFISFYAMEKTLRSGDEDVLVYVAPTKALVNQIAAEIHANFSKTYKYGGGKSVWAIHTRDYRVNNPTNCQILVTVPHILQIMLLSPSNAKTWSPRIKTIIFDEVHSIGQAEDGVIWEQLLLLAPCPVIALSATVGNPAAFSSWLSSTQNAAGFELETVVHPYRYSDLRKFVYAPPEKFAFRGVPERSNFSKLGLDGTSGFHFLHPVASLINKSRGMPDDLNLEARDMFTLSEAMSKYQNKKWPFPKTLLPANFLPEGEIGKRDLIRWETELKKILQSWINQADSPFDNVVHALGEPINTGEREQSAASTGSVKDVSDKEFKDIDGDDLLSTTLPLLTKLEEANALPAILFNYDRLKCEEICQSLLESLKSAESKWKKESKVWKRQIEEWETYKKIAEKKGKSAKGKPAQKSKKKGGEDDEGDDGGDMSKSDSLKDSASAERNPLEHFDPNEPCEGFHFAGKDLSQRSDLTKHFRTLRWKEVPEWLLESLLRGIGVHHAGMNRKYRQVVEIFFRRGFLRVVIATGTLSLGINMPCPTVVFSGDSVFLTALNFRQAAGRAGRRGFDYLGNVVFQGISTSKACRLLSSRLPDMNGHFPVTTSLILRMFALLHGSDNSPYAAKAINSLLSQPRLYLGGRSFKEQVLHHLRFSIEYLRRQGLIDAGGVPLNFAGCVSHLYYVENSSFAFHALLKSGYFNSLCSDIGTAEEQTLRKMMLVMAHLFGRRYCRQADAERKGDMKSPSIVFLPALPIEARNILAKHDAETLETFATYVQTFATQHLPEKERTLPLTGLKVGSDIERPTTGLPKPLPETISRSAFVALSGHGDSFDSIADLCSGTRQGIFLEKAVIPHLENDDRMPLNAYLYDFFMHGSLDPLETANGIRKSDVWFLLNDFSMVLATIVTSLFNFMNGTEGGDEMDMLDIQGSGDMAENMQDAEIAQQEDAEKPAALTEEAPKALPTRPVPGGPSLKAVKKAPVLDDWADEEGLDEPEPAPSITAETATTRSRRASGTSHTISAGDSSASSVSGWTDETSGKGLKNVLLAMQRLKEEFDIKFKKTWA